jgi:FtsP/CotA-like multicopper oxidase with cupredoxin domain
MISIKRIFFTFAAFAIIVFSWQIMAYAGVSRATITAAQRKGAAAYNAASRDSLTGAFNTMAAPLAAPGPGSTPDYFGVYPNYANSPFPTLSGTTITGGMRKFVDALPGFTPAGINDLGQYIPVAVADTAAYPNCDYYEIALVQFTVQMHKDLPPTTIRGYVQLETPANAGISKHIALMYPDGVTPIKNRAGQQVYAVDNPQYMGPAIVTETNRPVRVKFTNFLPTGSGGDLFIPADTELMGAGTGPLSDTELYTQNRATLHLHGGVNPWISDGTPNQWTTPASETTSYPKGVSVQYVPDMWFDSDGNTVAAGTPGASNNPGPGSLTFYYTNQQSARLMFYHDHALGITRLNVYAGEAAPYVVRDPVEDVLINGGTIGTTAVDAGTIPADEIPLVIQDKTFVPNNTTPYRNSLGTFQSQLAAQDPTWDTVKWGGMGSLWFPHVYMPNQSPTDPDGCNAMGRWDYGPWFWPPLTIAAGLVHGEIANPYAGTGPDEGPTIPGTPNPSITPEAFMDTPVINGTAYPTLTVQPKAYRFRILNASNDRSLNLSLFFAEPLGVTLINGGSGYTSAPTVGFSGGGGAGALAAASITSVVNAVTVTNGGSGYTAAPIVSITGGGGTGASAIASINPATGAVTGVTVTNPGAGYSAAAPLYVTFSGGGGTGAQASASITGIVSGITVSNPGSGWTSVPSVSLTGGGGTGALALASINTEVKMVPAVPNPAFPSTWPTDGRDGGVPDPAAAGPDIIQIGNEGGFLPAPVVIPATPVGYEYNRKSITVLNVYTHSLLLGPAERADIVVDFSQVPAGSSVILYNDSPAPIPAFDTRLDYYTGDPDQTNIGGAPTTLPGYGPNTRTMMRFQVAGTAAAQFNLSALQSALPVAYAASQPAPIVPETTYPAPNTAASDTYSHIQDTSLTFTPVGSVTPVTVDMQPKCIQELFELKYGRMNATLGTELPLTNFNTQTTVPLGYTDPPTEILQNGATQIWKITHNGVDTHFVHVHLFNLQVINRVGWDGTIKPPDPNELGWKETVRMNPLEDVIVAMKPVAPVVPFAMPDSVRPLDVTMPLGATWGSIDPITGNPVTITNALYNFGAEYVWHCHILGHEENDMMRPMVFLAGTTVPSAPIIGTAAAISSVAATVAFSPPLSDGGSPITSYTVTSNTGITATGTATPITVTGLTSGSTYTFTVTATNSIGTGPASAASNAVAMVPPAPTAATATISAAAPLTITVSWTDNAPAGVTGYIVQKSTNNFATISASFNTGLTTSYVDTHVRSNRTYYYRVIAVAGASNSALSAFSNVVFATTSAPAKPANLSAIATQAGATESIALSWTETSANVGSYRLQRSRNPLFTNVKIYTIAGTETSYTDTGLPGKVTYYYRIRAINGAGKSAFSKAVRVRTP